MKSCFLFFLISISGFCSAQTPDDAQIEIRYANFIYYGDKAFTAKNYDNAIYYYRKAILLNTEKQYPKDKICETYLLMPNMTTCPYATEANGYNQKKSNILIGIADSAFAKKDYEKARNNYYSVLFYYIPGQQYATRQVRFCDSVLNNNAFKTFQTKIPDSLVSVQDYSGARNYYEYAYENLMQMNRYLADSINYSAELKYVEQQISVCDLQLPLDWFRSVLSNEACDGIGTSAYCTNICISAAKTAEARKDYEAAEVFYDDIGDSNKVEEMKKLAAEKKN